MAAIFHGGLSKIGTIHDGDLRVVSDHIQEYIQSENGTILQVIADKINSRPGLLGVLFPSQIQKEHEVLSIQQMKDLFNDRQALISTYIQIQIELVKKAGDRLIVSKINQYEGELSKQAIQILADLTTFSQFKINEMETVFEESKTEFIQRIKRMKEEAEGCKDIDFLYDELQIDLRYETKVFFETIKELLKGFKEALQNKLSKCKA